MSDSAHLNSEFDSMEITPNQPDAGPPDLEQPDIHLSEELSDADPLVIASTSTMHSAHELNYGESSQEEAKKEVPQISPDLLLKLEGAATSSEKLAVFLNDMEATLNAGDRSPHFKRFWDVRQQALLLFKENAGLDRRAELWERYSTLSKEARRLKVQFDEQSAFAAEQIDIAIQALEAELEAPEAALEKITLDEFLADCSALAAHQSQYYQWQTALNLLNAQAGRITGLRKELIGTEIRVKLKNRFFQRLSAAGDKVFPQRKDLIKEVSEQFTADVDAFIKCHFGEDGSREPLYFLRDEIKILQNVAKIISLNTQTFTHTRMALSDCWDRLKVIDKERKRVRAEQKDRFKDNFDHLQSKLKALTEELEANPQSDELTVLAFRKYAEELRGTPLGREEHKALITELKLVHMPIEERLHAAEQERKLAAEEKEKFKRVKQAELSREIEAFVSALDSYDIHEMLMKRDELQLRVNDLAMTKGDKQALERLLDPVKEAAVDKREHALMLLPAGDREMILQLRELYENRKAQRQKIREQVEELRKLRASSGLDFSQAMQINEQEAEEKLRLEKVCQILSELEQKLVSIEELGNV